MDPITASILARIAIVFAEKGLKAALEHANKNEISVESATKYLRRGSTQRAKNMRRSNRKWKDARVECPWCGLRDIYINDGPGDYICPRTRGEKCRKTFTVK